MVEKYARFLAPLALAAVTVGIYVVVHDNLNHHPAAAPSRPPAVVNAPRRHRRAHHPGHVYVVRPGDTLSQISARTGVSVAQITRLNPTQAASPDSLQTGERLRLSQ